MRKVFLVLTVVLVVLAGCQARSNPEAMLATMEEALNAGDIDAALGDFADDAVVKLEPALPPGSPDTYVGKEEIHTWFEELVAGNFEINIEVLKVEGDTVTTRTSTWMDATREMGVAPLVATEVYTILDGKIKGFTWTISEESLAKIQAAMSPPLEEAIIGTWKWDSGITLYLQLNTGGTYHMHASPWGVAAGQKAGQTTLEALTVNPGDEGWYEVEGSRLTITSSDATVVCKPGDAAHIQIGITEDGKLSYALEADECGLRTPPGKLEHFSRVSP